MFAAVTIVLYGLDRTRPNYLGVEVPVLLVLLSTLTLRYSFSGGPRTAAQLTENPLDIFAMFNLGCTGLAFALALLAMTSQKSGTVRRVTTRPARLYALYACVAFMGIIVSVNPALTFFRVLEMLAGLLVVAGAYRTAGMAALQRIEAMIYWYSVLMMASAWLGVVASGGAGLERVNSPIPLRLIGILPHISSNTLGYLGVIVALWSLARLLERDEASPKRSVTILILGFSLLTLVAAQYRTGYAMFVAGTGLLLLVAGRKLMAGLALIVVLVISTSGAGILQDAQPYLLRGQDTERASRLSGRFNYWTAALPVWEESPVIGGGLKTASRLVALASLETEKGSASNLHSTWVEGLVGTGAVGVTLLALSLLTAWWRALYRALSGAGRIVPAIVLSALLIRTFTGGSIEGGGDTQLFFLTLAFGLRDRSPSHHPEMPEGHPERVSHRRAKHSREYGSDTYRGKVTGHTVTS
jgi:O-antigen ligase